jgi:FlaA1/EpsC-like NDP-sugar epimerase
MQNVSEFFSSQFQFNKSLLLNRGFQVALDSSCLAAAFLLAYLLRFEFEPDAATWRKCLLQMCLTVPVQLIAFRLSGVYKQIWRYISIPEANRIWIALWLAAVFLLVLRLFFYDLSAWTAIPISIIVIDFCAASAGVIGLRVFRRRIFERTQKKQTTVANKNKKPVFLIGAGKAGVNTLAEVKGRGDIDFEVKGFIDDDPLKKGAVINGVKVVGALADLPRLVKEHRIDHVIISIAQTSRANIKRIVKTCEQAPVRVRTIPGLYELLQDKVTVSRIRDIQIEDLLGRPAVELDHEAIEKSLKDKVVMVTGAGGSIGSELVRQILRCAPGEIILIDRSELALFNIEREVFELYPEIKYRALLADICNESQMSKIFEKFAPQVVFHAAAHKHVPLMERNTPEAVKNNVLGTLSIAELSGRHNTEAFVLISTDKAVNPTSVMGATKRVAELIIQNLNQTCATRFSAVRFGNVIGSAGSVIPIFQEQIKKGGPVTVTHPEMKRYFMTIPEATQLVLQAGTIGRGGEIFILDMGEQIKIVDLARETILLSGLRPDEDIEIVFKGVRPGEKLYEELQMTSEEMVKTFHPKIFIGKILPFEPELIREAIDKLSGFALREEEREIRRYLNEFLPEANLTQIGNEPQDLGELMPMAPRSAAAAGSGANQYSNSGGLLAPFSLPEPAGLN